MSDFLIKQGYDDLIFKKTGLRIDPYFSATKIKWIMENVSGVKEKIEKGEILFGTIDTYLIWRLTGGNVHVTDYSNASRTMLFNINTLEWDEEILGIMGIPTSILPEVKESSCIYGYADSKLFGGESIPIGGAAGDQQCALFGQNCMEKGSAKTTYGTGCFLLMNTGEKPVYSKNGLVSTIAWGIDGKITYALEGSIFMGGAVVQWLRDELKLINSASETAQAALSVEDSNGCYIVPAFTGLGAPYWDSYARGTITNLTRGVNRNHIIRAALEGIAYQVNDVIKVMEKDSNVRNDVIKVDGGASANDFLMQFQSDITGAYVYRPSCIETTALGAAFLAGLAVGFWEDIHELTQIQKIDKLFKPNMNDKNRKESLDGWKKAVERARL
jgi:glycerol kinase